jgi:hypothetical protein
MRPMFVVSAGVTLLLIASGTGWAGARNRAKGASSVTDSGKEKETPPAFNKTFQWEENVVGPKDKGVDHEKIAAMQERGRREDEAKRRDQMSGHANKKAARADGITGPATATLPTMDIEKPAPAGSVRSPMKKASYTPPRSHDDIDNVLAENGVGSSSGSESGSSDGLGGVLGGPSRAHGGGPSRAHVRTTASRHHANKHARARRRR